MTLRAILFDFNGVIINDEPIHQELISEMLIAEKVKFEPAELHALSIGRSDRACLTDLFYRSGQFITDEYLSNLIEIKAAAYRAKIQQLQTLPIFPDVIEFITQLQNKELIIALVTGALWQQTELVLQKANLTQYFSVIVTADDVNTSKPEPDGYLLAVTKLNQQNLALNLQSHECLVIEDSLAGIEAAKRAKMPVVAIANTYPFHLLQRRANWVVDSLAEIEIDRILEVI
ncbi:MAG: HAD family phosphatase [Cyanobacteria bacterium P01_F01_bin.143]